MMTRSQLEKVLSNHPSFSAERLYELCKGKSLTNRIMWDYLCELENWKPLEIVSTTNPEWLLVASTSKIGLWHRTSVVHQACDCPFSSSRVTQCCHLSAAMAHEENQWIAYAKELGFEVFCDNESYQVIDRNTKQQMGDLRFVDGIGWELSETKKNAPLVFAEVHEAIGYLAAVASFGWQLA